VNVSSGWHGLKIAISRLQQDNSNSLFLIFMRKDKNKRQVAMTTRRFLFTFQYILLDMNKYLKNHHPPQKVLALLELSSDFL